MNSDSPHVVAIPPLLFLPGLLVGCFLEWLMPLHVFPGAVPKCAGSVLATISGILAVSAFIVMRRAGTHIDVRRPALTVVTTGPFRFTRNPLYLSLVLLTLGLALRFDIAWAAVMLIPVTLIVHYGVIRREERYLESKFGEQYLEYKRKVRRWI